MSYSFDQSYFENTVETKDLNEAVHSQDMPIGFDQPNMDVIHNLSDHHYFSGNANSQQYHNVEELLPNSPYYNQCKYANSLSNNYVSSGNSLYSNPYPNFENFSNQNAHLLPPQQTVFSQPHQINLPQSHQMSLSLLQPQQQPQQFSFPCSQQIGLLHCQIDLPHSYQLGLPQHEIALQQPCRGGLQHQHQLDFPLSQQMSCSESQIQQNNFESFSQFDKLISHNVQSNSSFQASSEEKGSLVITKSTGQQYKQSQVCQNHFPQFSNENDGSEIDTFQTNRAPSSDGEIKQSSNKHFWLKTDQYNIQNISQTNFSCISNKEVQQESSEEQFQSHIDSTSLDIYNQGILEDNDDLLCDIFKIPEVLNTCTPDSLEMDSKNIFSYNQELNISGNKDEFVETEKQTVANMSNTIKEFRIKKADKKDQSNLSDIVDSSFKFNNVEDGSGNTSINDNINTHTSKNFVNNLDNFNENLSSLAKKSVKENKTDKSKWDEATLAGINSTSSITSDNLICFFKQEFMAVRNEEDSFYICRALHNIYKSSSKIKIRWLSSHKDNIYVPDHCDYIEYESILTTVNLKKVNRRKYILHESEESRINDILHISLAAEREIIPSPKTKTAQGTKVEKIGN